MEYFTHTLWNQLNSESATERAEAWNVRRNPAGRGHERMKKSALLLALVLLLATLTGCYSTIPGIDNETPPEEKITKYYPNETLAAADAWYQVRACYGDVYLQDVCSAFSLRAQCHRSTSDGEEYVLFRGATYRLYFFMDDTQKITTSLLTQRSWKKKGMEQSQRYLESTGVDVLNCTYAADFLTLSASNRFMRCYELILQEGVVAIEAPTLQRVAEGVRPVFHYYTDEEWSTACAEWDGYTILEIDRQWG